MGIEVKLKRGKRKDAYCRKTTLERQQWDKTSFTDKDMEVEICFGVKDNNDDDKLMVLDAQGRLPYFSWSDFTVEVDKMNKRLDMMPNDEFSHFSKDLGSIFLSTTDEKRHEILPQIILNMTGFWRNAYVNTYFNTCFNHDSDYALTPFLKYGTFSDICRAICKFYKWNGNFGCYREVLKNNVSSEFWDYLIKNYYI